MTQPHASETEDPIDAPTLAEATSDSEPDGPHADPITRPVSEAEARALASRLAREAFARGTYLDADGQPVAVPPYNPEDFEARLDRGRWHLSFTPPGGAWARVSFIAFGGGTQRSVEVGFATE